jgi:hypothetical protein
MVRAFDLLRRCQWEDANDVLGQRVLISGVALGGHVRPVVVAGHPVLLGDSMSTYMEQEGLSQDVSYDAYVKLDVDHMGRPEFSDAIAPFRGQRNAVTYKRQLDARGKTVHVQRNTVYDFSETKKSEWFMAYEPKAPPTDRPGTSRSAAAPNPLPPVDGSDSSDRRRQHWYRRWIGE